ncbi:hypothetical protein PMPD1_2317 [Paramixta manurensis]|uniref:Uncharacterized protein n=1 Tax=Paramixta manurensis TaxID=2740817 RepID=A0A6M8UK69_9GAMM|nr:hypothetical protein PMPD1_2317 [Erwiniaceae bacterium PD-1]
MEQRRYPGNSQWYHETQASLCAVTDSSQISHAAEPEDGFLPGLRKQADATLTPLLHGAQPALRIARDLHQVLFPPALETSLTHTLTLYDRLSTALTVAQVTGVQRLCNHYATRLNPLPGPDSSRESNNRLTQITQYARQLASQPTLIDAAALQRLDEVGLTTPDIITFSQIIGYVSYQARVVAGLQALSGMPVRWIPGVTIPDDAPAERFTQAVEWQPQLPPVELRYANAEQLEVLTFCQPQPGLQHIAWLLAHDARALYGWASLNAELEAAGDATDERLAEAVSARINGSAGCFAGYQGELAAALRIGVEEALQAAGKGSSAMAVINAAAQLTRSPERFSAAHLQPLQDCGLSSAAIFSLIQKIAFANWNNRLLQTLGTAG